MAIQASIVFAEGLRRFPFVYITGELETRLGTDIVYTTARPKQGDSVTFTHEGSTLFLTAYGDSEEMLLSLSDSDEDTVKRIGRGAWYDENSPVHRLFHPQNAECVG